MTDSNVELWEKEVDWDVLENEDSWNDEVFEELLKTYDYERPRRGQILECKVMMVDETGVLVDVGAKRDAFVPRSDLGRVESEFLENLSEGDTLPVYVLRSPKFGDDLLVSISRGLEKEDWDQAILIQEQDEAQELEVIGHNRGGLLVAFGRLQGFVPNSHVLDLPRGADQDTLSTQKAKMRGDKILVKVLEVEPRRERLVLSERAAKKEQRQRRLSQLDAGEHLTGTVTNIVDFGAFVDLDGVNGLIHLSELSWHWVDHPSDVLEVGQEVEVLVKKVSEERGRISLSRKALLPSPWDDVEARHSVSDLVSGEVTSLADFGAFVALKDGIEGLIHISELGIVGSLTPDSVVQPGETVLARIIEIDAERQRMSLSLNQVTYDEQMNWMAERQSEQELEYEPLEEDLIPAASQLELDDDAQEVPVGDDPQGTDEQRADLT